MEAVAQERGRTGRGTLLVALAVVLAYGVPLPFLEPSVLAGAFHDDAYYYFQIARHVARGDGFTFDGLHETNGFQPLWLFVLVPLFRLVDGGDGALYAVGALEVALLAGAFVIVFRTLRTRIGDGAALAGALLPLALSGSRLVLRGGMETSLLLFLWVLVWRQWLALERHEASHRDWRTLGLLAALLFLARLEALVAVPVLLFLARDRLRKDRGALASFLLIPTLCALAYCAWNRLQFGIWMPVSGLVKATAVASLPRATLLKGALDVPWSGEDVVYRFFGVASPWEAPWAAIAVHAALLAALALLAIRHRRRLAEAVGRAGLQFLVLSALCVTLADKVTVVRIWPWYRMPGLVVVPLVLAALVSPWRRVTRVLAVAVPLLAACRAPVTLLGAGTSWTTPTLEAARWMRAHTRPGTRVGSWNAGLLGYTAERPVVNLDGLVNDASFCKQVVRGRELRPYLEQTGIEIIADPGVSPAALGRYYEGEVLARWFAQRFELAAEFRRPDMPGWAYTVWRRRAPSPGSVRE